MVVLTVELRGERQRFTFDRPFKIGNTAACDVYLVTSAPQPHAIQIGVLPHEAFIASLDGHVDVELDGWRAPLSLRHPLRIGTVLKIHEAQITFDQVPVRAVETIDRDAARDFDRDVAEIEARRPPPRPQLDAHKLTMDDVDRARDPDPSELVLRPPSTLGELERVLGLVLPRDLFVPTHVYFRSGTASDHAVSGFSADLATGSLVPHGGHIENARSVWLSAYTIGWSCGRARCEAALAARHGPPVVASDGRTEYRVFGKYLVDANDGDAFTLHWSRFAPDWAVPYDRELRASALRELTTALSSSTRRPDILSRIAALPTAAGLRGSDTGHTIEIELSPRMSALELVMVLGLADVAWKRGHGTDDVPYHIVRIADGTPRPPRISAWILELRLDAHYPSGDHIAEVPYAMRLVAADRVRWIAVRN